MIECLFTCCSPQFQDSHRNILVSLMITIAAPLVKCSPLSVPSKLAFASVRGSGVCFQSMKGKTLNSLFGRSWLQMENMASYISSNSGLQTSTKANQRVTLHFVTSIFIYSVSIQLTQQSLVHRAAYYTV